MSARLPAWGLQIALAGLCLAAAGCRASTGAAVAVHGQPASHGNPGAPPGAGAAATASTVIPAQLGDTWVYAVDSSALGKGTEVARISAVRPGAGGQRATLQTSLRLAGSKAPFKFASTFTAGADGSVTFGSTSFMGSRLASANVNWPSPAALAQGQPHISTVSGSFLGIRTTERVTVTSLGTAQVTVPAGSYQATLLQQTVTSRGGGTEVIKTWVVAGIGQVKTVTVVQVKGSHSITSTQELTSFTKG